MTRYRTWQCHNRSAKSWSWWPLRRWGVGRQYHMTPIRQQSFNQSQSSICKWKPITGNQPLTRGHCVTKIWGNQRMHYDFLKFTLKTSWRLQWIFIILAKVVFWSLCARRPRTPSADRYKRTRQVFGVHHYLLSLTGMRSQYAIILLIVLTLTENLFSSFNWLLKNRSYTIWFDNLYFISW